MSDGVLDTTEQQELLETLNAFSNRDFEMGEVLKSTTLPLDIPEPELVFAGRHYCFTGTFSFGTRKVCETAVIERGGSCGAVTKKTNVLVIGVYTADSWKHSSFGTRSSDRELRSGRRSRSCPKHWTSFSATTRSPRHEPFVDTRRPGCRMAASAHRLHRLDRRRHADTAPVGEVHDRQAARLLIRTRPADPRHRDGRAARRASLDAALGQLARDVGPTSPACRGAQPRLRPADRQAEYRLLGLGCALAGLEAPAPSSSREAWPNLPAKRRRVPASVRRGAGGRTTRNDVLACMRIFLPSREGPTVDDDETCHAAV